MLGYPGELVRIACRHCIRAGRYDLATLFDGCLRWQVYKCRTKNSTASCAGIPRTFSITSGVMLG
jgi:hypothetical protein